MHLFSALPLGPLKSLHIWVLMGHDNRVKNCKPTRLENLWGEVTWRAHYYCSNWQLSSKRLQKLLHKCNIPITSLLFKCRNMKIQLTELSLPWKCFHLKEALKTPLGEKTCVNTQHTGLYESDTDPVNLSNQTCAFRMRPQMLLCPPAPSFPILAL